MPELQPGAVLREPRLRPLRLPAWVPAEAGRSERAHDPRRGVAGDGCTGLRLALLRQRAIRRVQLADPERVRRAFLPRLPAQPHGARPLRRGEPDRLAEDGTGQAPPVLYADASTPADAQPDRRA